MLREARLTQSPEDRVRMETLPRRAWGSRELAAATLHLGGGGGKGEAIEDRSTMMVPPLQQSCQTFLHTPFLSLQLHIHLYLEQYHTPSLVSFSV